MSGRDIDGAYLTEPWDRARATARRKVLIKAKRCINGPLEQAIRASRVEHGPVVPGTSKCQRCLDVAKRSR